MNPAVKTALAPVLGRPRAEPREGPCDGLREGPRDPAVVIAELQEEISRLRQAIISHAVVDQAIGVVIALEGLRPQEACQILKQVSQSTNTKLRKVAEQIVEAVQGGRLPEEIRQAMGAALSRAKTG